MDKIQMNGHSFSQLATDEDFEIMGDIVKEDPVVVELRRLRNNEITKKLGSYLLKGYCMLSDACPECDCILLRTPERELLCVGCAEVDVDNKKNNNNHKEPIKEEKDERLTSAEPMSKKKDRVKRSKKRSKNTSSTSEGDNMPSGNTSYSAQLEMKLKWAVDELAKSQNPNRINAMCTVIVKLTESIKALKEYETACA